MKRLFTGLMVALAALLCACGQTRIDTASIQAQYGGIAAAQMEAEAVCHLPEESRTYSLRCSVDGNCAETTVEDPPQLKGLTARLAEDGLTVLYDDDVLSAGTLEDICPANCLPYLLRALADGYLIEYSREELEDVPCIRLTLDTTAPSGEKVLCPAWIGEEDLLPRYAEFSQENTVVLTLDMRSFSCQMMEE